MSNIAQVLREEIRRLAKREAKAIGAPLKKDIVRQKKIAVQLRRDVKQLKRDNGLLMASERRRQQAQPVITAEGGKARLTAKGIRAMRRKLGISQAAFGKLVGVSTVIVGIWEKKEGALRLKDKTRAGILSLRGIGAREAKKRLEMVGAGSEKKVRKAAGRKAKRVTARKGRGKRAKR
jgi:DNA-binding transcriptional regulator YiaG